LSYAHRSLAPYQRIRRIEFMALPKTISGKIRRVELRTRENSSQPDVSAGEHRDRRSHSRPCSDADPVWTVRKN
jgi:acetyl-CoA synthetase